MAEDDVAPPIQLISVDSIEGLVDHLDFRERYFTLLLAWDAPELTQSELIEKMRPLVARGLVYFCAWGNRCEAVHDAVDGADMERIGASGSEDYVIMTTWHSKDPLSKACWYFKWLAMPTEEPYASNYERFAVAVGRSDWGQEMTLAFASA